MRLCWERSFIPSPPKSQPSGNYLLALVGPTASGKTAIACEIAKRLPVEMISCDSMQVYKSMPILTQAPTTAEKKKLKMHLVSFLNPSEDYNAAFFRRDALKAIEKIQKKRRLPLLVGGTGLYLRALMDGLFEAEGDEGRDDRLREKLESEQKTYGGNWLHDQLSKADPASAVKIHPHDIRRIVRALEVYHGTGKPISEHKPKREGIRYLFSCRIFLLNRERPELYSRIERRVDQMVKKGLLAEVRRLSRMKPGLTASMALGYRQMKMVCEKKILLEEATTLLKRDTRHYAKRQLSWFRHEKNIEMMPVKLGEAPAVIARKIVTLWEAGQ